MANAATNERPRSSRAYIVIMNVSAATPKTVIMNSVEQTVRKAIPPLAYASLPLTGHEAVVEVGDGFRFAVLDTLERLPDGVHDAAVRQFDHRPAAAQGMLGRQVDPVTSVASHDELSDVGTEREDRLTNRRRSESLAVELVERVVYRR